MYFWGCLPTEFVLIIEDTIQERPQGELMEKSMLENNVAFRKEILLLGSTHRESTGDRPFC